jgi:hypothetical protein
MAQLKRGSVKAFGHLQDLMNQFKVVNVGSRGDRLGVISMRKAKKRRRDEKGFGEVEGEGRRSIAQDSQTRRISLSGR